MLDIDKTIKEVLDYFSFTDSDIVEKDLIESGIDFYTEGETYKYSDKEILQEYRYEFNENAPNGISKVK